MIDSTRLERLGRLPFPAHLLLYALVVLGVVWFGGVHATASSDEGAYLVQARALDRGGWAIDYPSASSDPGYGHYPFINATLTAKGGYLFDKRPAYPWLEAKVVNALGATWGARVLSIVGALATAAAAWATLVVLHRRRLAPLGFWLAGLGPPLVNAGLIWAHALSAGLAGGAVLAAVALVQGSGRRWAWPLLAACLVGGVLIRSEGILLALAVLAVLAVVLLLHRRWRSIMVLAGVGSLAALTFLAQRRWNQSIIEGSRIVAAGGAAATAAPGFVSARSQAVWHDLLASAYIHENVSAVGLLALCFIAVAVLLLARGGPGRRRDLAVASSAAVAALVLRIAAAPDDVIPGLLLGWPVVLIALAGGRWSVLRDAERAVAGLAALFGAAVLATDYAEGGGFQWAGRYLSPLAVPVAVLAAIAIAEVLMPAAGASGTRHGRQLAGAGLAVLAVGPSLLGVWSMRSFRQTSDALVRDAHLAEAPITVTTIGSLPRLDAEAYPEQRYLLARDEEVASALAMAAHDGAARIGLVGPQHAPALAGYRIVQPEPGVQVWRYERS